MVLWLFTCSFLITRSFHLLLSQPSAIAFSVPCPLCPSVARRTPQTLQKAGGGAELRPYHRYRTAVAAGIAGNGKTDRKHAAGCQSCPLCKIFCLVNLTRIGKGSGAGFRIFGPDNLHA